MSTTRTDRSPGLSSWSATLLVAEREILSQVRSKSFIISNVITLVLVLGGIVVANLFGGQGGFGSSDAPRVAVVTGALDAAVEGVEVVEVPDRAAAEELVRSEDVVAAVVPDDSALGVQLVALEQAPGAVVDAFSVTPEVEVLEPRATSDDLRFLIAIGFGLVFMMSALGSGAMIVQNTVQEKQSRVVEILLTAIPARALMAGKILGNSVIGVGSAAALAAAAALGLAITGQTALLDLLSAPLIWFVVFFLFGFVLVASIFAAGAALVSRQEDSGAVMTPAMMLVMIPYFAVVFLSDNPVGMTILSYVPFSAPVGMPVRLFFGEALWWEPLLSLAVLALSTFLVMTVASRIYTRSLLKMGSRVPLREALRSGEG